MRTRVGYTGGGTTNPTYHRLGDHTESLQIDFDPAVISYSKLLEEFFATHNACARPYSRQYMSAIFVHDVGQRREAEAAKASHQTRRGQSVVTKIEDLATFYLAEDYHQKYRLRGNKTVCAELTAVYPTSKDFLASPTVTRINAWLAGQSAPALVQRELPLTGLSTSSQTTVRQRFGLK